MDTMKNNQVKLDDPVEKIGGIGPKSTKKLNYLGIKNIQDLIYYFPRSWKDYSHPLPINSFRIGQDAIIRASISRIMPVKTARKRMFIIKAELIDDTGATIKAVWFNQPYLLKFLKEDGIWIFAGKIGYDFNEREKNIISPEFVNQKIIAPIYHETKGITSKFLAKIIKQILQTIKIEDFLPSELKNKENLMHLSDALWQIHFPSDQKKLVDAKKRLSFDELFLLCLKMQIKRNKFKKFLASKLNVEKKSFFDFINNLPYKLTKAQDKALKEIMVDISYDHPMIRLLNGDVGSGKTIVAAIATLIAIKSGKQTAWMAPTEILATQHYNNLIQLFKNHPEVKISLVTAGKIICGKTNYKNKNQACKQINSSDIIIGTHSLIQGDINFSNLALVVVDEEHRFGIKQRAALFVRGSSVSSSASGLHKLTLMPHYLAMSATPIPRTLAISVYGNLDLSLIDEMPPGRIKIVTRLVSPMNRKIAYEFIGRQIKNGRQAFVICPLIEIKESKTKDKLLLDIEKKSVKKEFDRLSKEIFPQFKIGCLHGKMKATEKQKIMNDFTKGAIDILVSTSVVEVGVDIPNATIMMIEDSDRFGLAQLHQFRGRVGRGKFQSYCLLFTNSLNPKTKLRLESMEKYSSGFKLAELDLSSRGPGELLGSQQSGFLQLKIAKLTDTITLVKAKNQAKFILNSGLDKYPKIKQIVVSNDKKMAN